MGTHNTKPVVVVPVIRVVVVALGTAQVLCIVVPRAAAQSAGSSLAPLLPRVFYPSAQKLSQLDQLAAAEFVGLQIDKTHFIT